MTNVSRRFLVLVFAGTFAAAGVRGGTSDQKTVATATEEEPEEYKNWIELAIGGVAGRVEMMVEFHRARPRWNSRFQDSKFQMMMSLESGTWHLESGIPLVV